MNHETFDLLRSAYINKSDSKLVVQTQVLSLYFYRFCLYYNGECIVNEPFSRVPTCRFDLKGVDGDYVIEFIYKDQDRIEYSYELSLTIIKGKILQENRVEIIKTVSIDPKLLSVSSSSYEDYPGRSIIIDSFELNSFGINDFKKYIYIAFDDFSKEIFYLCSDYKNYNCVIMMLKEICKLTSYKVAQIVFDDSYSTKGFSKLVKYCKNNEIGISVEKVKENVSYDKAYQYIVDLLEEYLNSYIIVGCNYDKVLVGFVNKYNVIDKNKLIHHETPHTRISSFFNVN
ncbi:hypothetical protein IB633_00090 [Francisella philomiragia]|uniref:Integrase core domain protein n=1 Tax=Francisella philomiragia subsp. philomiragia (strain ATCC 25017 / CCUG 19701 / FSC 153 / O\|nr:hypothetical protein [Francisella philomiragia]AJI46961.1 hypothetical protein BF30_1418 [Francisella philomiragia]AJI49528.1 hypothetical protein KU46_140 [Francisella philomiragia]MBK2019708.1 hypothetical protein [Francisella philomiragia]MBK2029513.1 hypothetical protein [Francisella philomiragia]MBK2264039.1 hypothetical protein [Francisella philomiragia]